jgi:type I site-specific restriction-modification system R (restriction) subunit
MINYYVKPATKKEIANYDKVEKIFDEKDLFDLVFDLLDKEDIANLLKNFVKGEELKALLKTCHITEKEFCMWYFTEEA